jgi:hypothetical protein
MRARVSKDEDVGVLRQELAEAGTATIPGA